VTPVLIQGLKDPDPQYRLRAGLLLFHLGPAARSVVSEQRVALENKDPAVRILAATTLARINPQTEGIVPVLRSGLAFNDYAIREQVFSAIQSIGPAGREFVPELLRVMKNKSDGTFRSSAAFALLNTGAAAEEVGPALAAMVNDPDPQLRNAALHCLSRMKLSDKKLLAILLDQMRDTPIEWQHHELFNAIQQFGPAANEEALKRLNDKDPQV